MAKTGATIIGVEKTIAKLRRLGDLGVSTIEEVTEIAARDIQAHAKRNAPVDLGTLRQNIVVNTITPMSYEVVSLAPYSAYQEFGTGTSVSIPNEFAEIASQWRGKGVKQVNLRPQPFMYPAYIKGREQYRIDLEAQLNALIKKNE